MPGAAPTSRVPGNLLCAEAQGFVKTPGNVIQHSMPRMSTGTATTIALKILAFLAESDEALERLFALTGMDVDTLRAQADEPETLAAVVDYLLGNEPLLIRFCESSGLDPKNIHMASHMLANA